MADLSGYFLSAALPGLAERTGGETVLLRAQVTYSQRERKVRCSVFGVNLSSAVVREVEEGDPDAVREGVADFVAAEVKKAVMVAIVGDPLLAGNDLGGNDDYR